MSQPKDATDPVPTGGPAWQLEFARLIAFPAEPVLGLQQNWWQELVGSQPEDYTLTRKKDSQREQGTIENVGLSLTIDPHRRIEWLIEPPGQIDESGGSLPTIGQFRQRLAWFTCLMVPWLGRFAPPILRLAFVCKLLQPAATQEEVYRALERLLPGVKLTPRPNDFLYHVNRRRKSKAVDGLEINRMSTWSKLNVLFSVEPGQPFAWPEKGYSAVQLDINTAPEKGGVLSADILSRLFEELVTFAIEIAEQGDIE